MLIGIILVLLLVFGSGGEKINETIGESKISQDRERAFAMLPLGQVVTQSSLRSQSVGMQDSQLR